MRLLRQRGKNDNPTKIEVLEARMVGWISIIAGSSLLLLFGFYFVIFKLFIAVDFTYTFDEYTVIASLYFLSIVLIIIVLDLMLCFKVIVWSFSAIFHLGLIVYFYFKLGAVAILLFPEFAIFYLSAVFLYYLWVDQISAEE